MAANVMMGLVNYTLRVSVLFSLGVLFSVLIDHLQKEHDITRYPKNVSQLFASASWVPISSGFAASLVGTLFPLMDVVFSNRPHSTRRDWSNVLRCCGIFLGVNYAASKLPWTHPVQVSVSLALLSIALWFIFDRTVHGFLFSSFIATIGTWVVHLLVSHGAYSFTQADFYGVRSWFPCILYSSCIFFGSIGRQLAIVPDAFYSDCAPKKVL